VAGRAAAGIFSCKIRPTGKGGVGCGCLPLLVFFFLPPAARADFFKPCAGPIVEGNPPFGWANWITIASAWTEAAELAGAGRQNRIPKHHW